MNGFYDYKNKYSAGATKETCPAKVDEETSQRMQRWAEKACEAAGIKAFARVDELMNEDGQIFCLEINTSGNDSNKPCSSGSTGSWNFI